MRVADDAASQQLVRPQKTVVHHQELDDGMLESIFHNIEGEGFVEDGVDGVA